MRRLNLMGIAYTVAIIVFALWIYHKTIGRGATY